MESLINQEGYILKKVSLVIVSMLLISVLAGCGGISIPDGDGGKIKLGKDTIEFTDENGETGSISVDEKSGSVSFEGSDGSASFSAGGGLPEGWPVDFMPIIDGGEVIQGGRVEEESDGEKHVTIHAVVDIDMSMDEVAAFYGDVMKGAEDLTKMNSKNMTTIGGVLDGIETLILIQPNGSVDNAEFVITLNIPID